MSVDNGPITFTVMYSEVQRELMLRRSVYNRMSRVGSINPITAQRQIAIMEAIGQHLKPLADLERQAVEPKLI